MFVCFFLHCHLYSFLASMKSITCFCLLLESVGILCVCLLLLILQACNYVYSLCNNKMVLDWESSLWRNSRPGVGACIASSSSMLLLDISTSNKDVISLAERVGSTVDI